MKILSVDDKGENRYLLESILIPSGHVVVSAVDGIDALQHLRKEPFDVIVSDLLMPNMDGYQLLRECKKDPLLKKIPFIIYTATYTEKKEIDFGLSLGAARYIIKPIEPDEFVEMISGVFDEISTGALAETEPEITSETGYTVEHIRVLTEKMDRKVRALEKQQEQYRLLADNISDVIWLLEVSKEQFIYISPSVFLLRGFTPEEAMAQHLSTALTLESYQYITNNLPDWLARFEAGDDTVRVQRHELDQTRKDGTVVPTESVFTFLAGPDRRVTQVLGVTRDITERKQAEKAIVESEQRFHTIFDAAQDAMIVADLNSLQVVMVNAAGLKLTGYTETELLSLPIFKINPPAVLSQVSDQFDKQVRGEIHLSPEVPILRKDGTVIFADVTSSKVILKDRECILGIFRDITERKRAEEERARLVAIVEQSDEAIIGKSLDGTITSWNAGGERMYGYSAQEVVGKNIALLLPPDHTDDTKDILERVRKGEPLIRYETLRMKKDGDLINVILTASPIRDSQNELIGVSIIGHDITERKKAEMLITLSKHKLGLMNDVTYQDIQNKVTALRGYAHFTRSAQTEEERSAFIGKTEKILSDIHALIKNTKDYQEMGLNQPRWIPIEHSIRLAAASVIPKPTVPIDTDLRGLELNTDPLLEKVFLYLIDNAMVHGKGLTRISFSCQEVPEGLILICKDDGAGIDPRKRVTLFSRITGDHPRFGLFFISEYLALAGMSIRETGETGKGARFEITVPKDAYRFSETGRK